MKCDDCGNDMIPDPPEGLEKYGKTYTPKGWECTHCKYWWLPRTEDLVEVEIK